MNRFLTAFAASLCLTAAFQSGASAQDYTAPQVVVSADKVRYGGKIFYMHVVQGRQTLYSISKAYNVTIQEIYDSNPTLHLETEGLKKDQIILIPIKGAATGKEQKESPEAPQPTKAEAPASDTADLTSSEDNGSDEYFTHRVKWFEDLASIARKYSVSVESIMNINGMTSDKVKRKDVIKIPREPEKWEKVKASVAEESASTATRTGSTETGDGQNAGETSQDNWFDKIFKPKREVAVSLLLPFNASRKADPQMMDFYSGALLAVKDLGENGVDVNLSVYDNAGGTMPMTEERFAQSDFIIGPVSNADIARTVNACKGKSWIVSPLDPKAEALADTIPNIIQAPAPSSAQIKDMVRWVRSDIEASDKVLLISQKGASTNGYPTEVINEVNSSGIQHSTFSFNILEGRSIMERLAGMMTGNGTNRVIIASESKAFVIEVVRLLYLVSSQKKDIVLYSTSKLRTYDEIDVEQLHSLNLHASVSYFVDYDSKDVQNFLMAYRALYNTEPSRSAFQGYDLMTCFSTLCSDQGWKKTGSGKIEGKGLQSDFHLVKTARGGYVNQAVRRVVYERDYSVVKVK